MLSEEDDEGTSPQEDEHPASPVHDPDHPNRKQHVVHRYKKPTLQNDHLFISSISNPNSNEFKAPISPTRQIAMMLWSTLWWYFHQPEPSPTLANQACARTAEEGRPRGEWKININREGLFKGKSILAKLERMGLISCEDSSVGITTSDKPDATFSNMFISRRAFWQLDARIYLFTLEPVINSTLPAAGSPFPSRPSSPQRGAGRDSPGFEHGEFHSRGTHSPSSFGPFQSSSHLPTYYPPHPTQFTFTNNIRHPIRPKPFRQGETFYCRYVPSVGQYLSFRVASLSTKPQSRQGPWSVSQGGMWSGFHSPRPSLSDNLFPTLGNLELEGESDLQLMHRWMNDPRISYAWGEQGPMVHQEEFLKRGLSSKHTFPVIGCWDGKPFGYFEIYWVKEDVLGKHLGGQVDDYDRGLHCLVGEQEFRGPHRVRIWLSALVHYCWLADLRTNCVMMEPRIDNAKLFDYCQQVGFFKEQEVTFPHKQAMVLKVRRDAWEKPVT